VAPIGSTAVQEVIVIKKSRRESVPGVGKLTLIDPELLSVENLRHTLTSRHLGTAKAHALAEWLREINPELEVEARQEA
jgi:tRNA A37 threonylcarbamoyladenosine dehydratase